MKCNNNAASSRFLFINMIVDSSRLQMAVGSSSGFLWLSELLL
jgi:hypothetical protein